MTTNRSKPQVMAAMHGHRSPQSDRMADPESAIPDSEQRAIAAQEVTMHTGVSPGSHEDWYRDDSP